MSSSTRAGANVRFRYILLLRLINAWSMATFFQPDEFFQSLEPAWRIAFGPDSGAWLTWEWQFQLRSSLHPLLFSVPYLVADAVSRSFLHIGSSAALRSSMLIAAPATLQGLIAALGDWYAWKFAEQIYGIDTAAATFTLLLQIVSPWQWYCSSRTFSNSLETTLTIMALNYWPWQLINSANIRLERENPKPVMSLRNFSVLRLRMSLSLALLAIVLRPTNVLIWLTIALFVLWRMVPYLSSRSVQSIALVLLREALLCGTTIIGLSLLADRCYFGFWTFPPYNWLHFNISKSLAIFYGSHPWHYYLFQGLPLLCTTSLPFVLPALYQPRASTPAYAGTLRALSTTVLVTITALSYISHKEVRFIYPLLPILNIFAAPVAATFFTKRTPKPTSPPTRKQQRNPVLCHKGYLVTGLFVNLLLAGYLSYAHQRAPLSVLSYLRSQFQRIHYPGPRQMLDNRTKASDELFALFLMPCHSTPWRSHLIYTDLKAYALTCEPPLHTEPNSPERDNYRDEADRFYDDPIQFLSSELFSSSAALQNSSLLLHPPRYIVGFEGIEPWLRRFSSTTPEGKALDFQLEKVWSGFNGLFHEDWRRAGNIVVWDTGVYQSE